MKNLLLIFCILAVLAPGCSSENANTATESANFAAPTKTPSVAMKPEDYPKTIAGQADRIQAEGLSDEQIGKNIADISKEITYEHLKKNSAKYCGQPWAVRGKILQIQEANGDTMARVALDDWGNKVVWVAARFPTDFIENNQIYAVGYLAGNYEYESQAGWNISIPALVARAIIKPAEISKYRTPSKKK